MRKNCENGRSMVEMLGVLAIIGVLSVGGIAGYSKAMFKYKINKMLDIASHALSRIVELGSSNVNGSWEVADLGVVDCESRYGPCYVPYGNIKGEFSTTSVYFTLQFDGDMAVDACTAYLSSGIYNYIPEDWWYPNGHIYVYNGPDTEYFYGKSDYAIEKGAKPNVTGADIARVCAVCGDMNNGYEPSCRVVWTMKNAG